MIHLVSTPLDQSKRWRFRLGIGKGAPRLGNVLACHATANHEKRTWRFVLAIPYIFHLAVELPLFPDRWGGLWLSRGEEGYAQYGFWHDYYETKLQWRKNVHLNTPSGGWEKRRLHTHGKESVVRQETLLTHLVAKEVDPWAKEKGFDRWAFSLQICRKQDGHFLYPSSYEYSLILGVTDKSGVPREATFNLIEPWHYDMNDVLHLLQSEVI